MFCKKSKVSMTLLFFYLFMGYNKIGEDMKNKKGFTLVELIATITIMVLIGLVIANNMTGILSKQNDENYNSFKKELEDGACVYVETKWDSSKRNTCKQANNCSVSVDELIFGGLIAEDLKDPNTGEEIRNNKDKYRINVRWVDNVKTCTVNG